MPPILPLIIVLLLGIFLLVPIGKHLINRRKREQLLTADLPETSKEMLTKLVPLYARLPDSLKPNLYGAIQYFLAEKVFVGCNGFDVTEEVKLAIAGNACLLVIGREQRYFPGFETILVYPETYAAPQVSYDGLVEVHHDSGRLGESWHRGPIVLAWSDVVEGSINPDDGHNVVLHEFAHKLDEENNIMDGLPVLRNPEDYQQWAEVLTKEFEAFKRRVAKHTNKVIDSYGAVSAPEFFAVATESFFEKPQMMESRIPDLYEQFKRFYGLDPAKWR